MGNDPADDLEALEKLILPVMVPAEVPDSDGPEEDIFDVIAIEAEPAFRKIDAQVRKEGL